MLNIAKRQQHSKAKAAIIKVAISHLANTLKEIENEKRNCLQRSCFYQQQ